MFIEVPVSLNGLLYMLTFMLVLFVLSFAVVMIVDHMLKILKKDMREP